jgi:hypothetical protein
MNTINGLTYIGNQLMGASVTVPIADVFAATLASGAAVGTSTGGNGVPAWPAPQPGVGK